MRHILFTSGHRDDVRTPGSVRYFAQSESNGRICGDREATAAALGDVCRAPTVDAAAVAPDAFDAGPRGTTYSPLAVLWRRAREQAIPVCAFAPDIQRLAHLSDQIPQMAISKPRPNPQPSNTYVSISRL